MQELRSERLFQDKLNKIFHEIYENDVSLEEMARKALSLAMGLTGVERGGVFHYTNDGVRMLAHYCETPCTDCTLLEFREQLSHLDNKDFLLQEETQAQSFFVNIEQDEQWKAHNLTTRCNVQVRSFLASRANLNENQYVELILLNGLSDFEDYQLEWVKKILGLFSLVQKHEDTRKALFEAQNEVIEVSKSKAQFLANVSHEIRSPLNGVICMASLLKESKLDEEQQELLNIIQFSAENITRIIQDLLDLTQISTGKMNIRMESFSLSEMLSHLMQNFRSEIEDRNLEFEYSLQENLDMFTGDRVRISQIISNLVHNAVKYTEEGRIFVDLREDNDHLIVVVSDTGVGIPEDKLDSVFEQFVQLQSPGKGKKKSGVGLGLSIVKELVELMGGHIELRSRVGRGSTFQISLPSGGILAEKEAVQEQQRQYSQGGPIRVLIAEDDGINSLYLNTLLSRKGYQVDVAENGALAVNLCRMNPYHLILMDVSMPVMDGLEATREIRQFAPDMSIIAVTAHAYEEDQRRIRSAGMNDIVLKPIDEVDLMHAIQRQLVQR